MITTAHDIPSDRLRWQHTVPAGTHWSGLMRRGMALRLTDLEGGDPLHGLGQVRHVKAASVPTPDR